MNKNKEQLYSQCLLRKRIGNLSVIDVSWIPVEYAIVGKCIKFWNYDMNKAHGMKGVWDDGWIVIKTYGTRNESDIIKMTWDYRKWSEVKA